MFFAKDSLIPAGSSPPSSSETSVSVRKNHSMCLVEDSTKACHSHQYPPRVLHPQHNHHHSQQYHHYQPYSWLETSNAVTPVTNALNVADSHGPESDMYSRMGYAQQFTNVNSVGTYFNTSAPSSQNSSLSMWNQTTPEVASTSGAYYGLDGPTNTGSIALGGDTNGQHPQSSTSATNSNTDSRSPLMFTETTWHSSLVGNQEHTGDVTKGSSSLLNNRCDAYSSEETQSNRSKSSLSNFSSPSPSMSSYSPYPVSHSQHYHQQQLPSHQHPSYRASSLSHSPRPSSYTHPQPPPLPANMSSSSPSLFPSLYHSNQPLSQQQSSNQTQQQQARQSSPGIKLRQTDQTWK